MTLLLLEQDLLPMLLQITIVEFFSEIIIHELPWPFPGTLHTGGHMNLIK